MLSRDTTRSIVVEAIAALLEESGAERSEISGSQSLIDVGLGSLLIARLIIQLETEIGVDPFAEDILISDIRSIDELVNAYHSALSRSIAV